MTLMTSSLVQFQSLSILSVQTILCFLNFLAAAAGVRSVSPGQEAREGEESDVRSTSVEEASWKNWAEKAVSSTARINATDDDELFAGVAANPSFGNPATNDDEIFGTVQNDTLDDGVLLSSLDNSAGE